MDYQGGSERRVWDLIAFGLHGRRPDRVWPGTLAVGALLALCVACTGSGQADDSTVTAIDVQGSSDAGGLPSAQPVNPDAKLHCERYAYPCDLNEVSETVRDRSDELSGNAIEILANDGELLERINATADWLSDQPDVIDVNADEIFLTGLILRHDCRTHR